MQTVRVRTLLGKSRFEHCLDFLQSVPLQAVVHVDERGALAILGDRGPARRVGVGPLPHGGISKQAVVKIEAFGYTGPACLKIIEPIQQALGVASSVEAKPEFFAATEQQAFE